MKASWTYRFLGIKLDDTDMQFSKLDRSEGKIVRKIQAEFQRTGNILAARNSAILFAKEELQKLNQKFLDEETSIVISPEFIEYCQKNGPAICPQIFKREFKDSYPDYKLTIEEEEKEEDLELENLKDLNPTSKKFKRTRKFYEKMRKLSNS